ncbi:MAG: hypothetical protein HIU57_03075 [Acidobacteria bacterium]|nr:hypothetical protein [Acidobacteriota bacterium]
MLALIVAVFWLAILAPWAVVKFRNSRAERSIDSFHVEHERLSRQGYAVAPVRRLDDAYLYEEHSYEPEHEPTRARPRLTVVHDSDTYSTLESRSSWDEWERDYDYDHPRSLTPSFESNQHRYAAYASAPAREAPVARRAPLAYDEGFVGAPLHGSMRVRRNRIFTSLSLSAVVTTGLDLLIGLSLLQFLAVLSWIGLVFYVAAALFAVSQGYLAASSLVGARRTKAYAPAYYDEGLSGDEESSVLYADEQYYDDTAYEVAVDGGRWRREPRHFALG